MRSPLTLEHDAPEVDEDDPAHILSGLIYGRTERQGLNPLTWPWSKYLLDPMTVMGP
jgi:hypothetical protein